LYTLVVDTVVQESGTDIIPSKPFPILIHLDGYPYPSLGVRVLMGIGIGTGKKPRSYLGHTLMSQGPKDKLTSGEQAEWCKSSTNSARRFL
jgi:hypothetical protein